MIWSVSPMICSDGTPISRPSSLSNSCEWLLERLLNPAMRTTNLKSYSNSLVKWKTRLKPKRSEFSYHWVLSDNRRLRPKPSLDWSRGGHRRGPQSEKRFSPHITSLRNPYKCPTPDPNGSNRDQPLRTTSSWLPKTVPISRWNSDSQLSHT